ncbi:hypothetical protein NKI56_34820 [Mesorhizobium sp. M0622]|uniref:hypothetical protein n=1 Tax=Mesorhizobium sp. M0622 TaxID=2956975 RepID=UPI003336CF64
MTLLFAEITRQFSDPGEGIGTPVDAAIIASASEDDEEGHWVKHKGRPAFHCSKAHFGAYADTALVEEIAVTATTPRTATPFLMLCPTIPAKCLPTAPTEAIISATRCAPRVEGRASPDAMARAKGSRSNSPHCDRLQHETQLDGRFAAMWGRDEAESSTPGTNRSREFVVRSRRSSVPGNVPHR